MAPKSVKTGYSPIRLLPEETSGLGVTADNTEQANLSGFRLEAGHQSTRAESAFGVAGAPLPCS
jgi:hypothetical protein